MFEIGVLAAVMYIVYFIVSVTKFDKNGHVKKSKKNKKKKRSTEEQKKDDFLSLPAEVKYFIRKYNVDLDKVNLRGVLKVVGLVLGVDIAIVTVVSVLLFKKLTYQMILSIVLIIPMYLISLKFLAKAFKKRGLIKDV